MPDTAYRCARCGSDQVARIPGQTGAYGSGNNIPRGPWIFSAVPIARYVCLSCGFVDEWVDDPADLATLRAKYAPPPR